ncbi:TadE/TadG family type IV pilus assembly protein [Paramixta manurensis]
MPAFAIIIPAILAMMMLGIDSANALAQKARLINAVGEASLAISANGKKVMTENEREEAQALTEAYIRYYLPSILSRPQLDIHTEEIKELTNGLEYIDYQLAATVKVPLLFDVGVIAGLSRELDISTGPSHARKYSMKPADYVFVINFSEDLREVRPIVKEISESVLINNDQNKIAIVPYANGVPLRTDRRNEAGGQEFDCSMLVVPKKEYAINYGFWADKQITDQYNGLDEASRHNARMFYMDRGRFSYYNSFVRNGFPGMDYFTMVNRWCINNGDITFNESHGRWKYTCKTEDKPWSDIFSADSQAIIRGEYDRALRVHAQHERYHSLLHDEAIDYEATLEKMFTDEALISFPLPWTFIDLPPGHDLGHRLFDNMCRQAGWNYDRPPSRNPIEAPILRAWLIGLTNQPDSVNQLQQMTGVGGGAFIAMGLVRAVPEMMKGVNRRKVFIIISDGTDYGGNQVTDNLLRRHQLCQKIEQGVLARPQTKAEEVAFYYIAYRSYYDYYGVESAAFWAEHCTGPERARAVENREELVELLKGIMTDEVGHFAR